VALDGGLGVLAGPAARQVMLYALLAAVCCVMLTVCCVLCAGSCVAACVAGTAHPNDLFWNGVGLRGMKQADGTIQLLQPLAITKKRPQLYLRPEADVDGGLPAAGGAEGRSA
jgi:hypothetical protein